MNYNRSIQNNSQSGSLSYAEYQFNKKNNYFSPNQNRIRAKTKTSGEINTSTSLKKESPYKPKTNQSPSQNKQNKSSHNDSKYSIPKSQSGHWCVFDENQSQEHNDKEFKKHHVQNMKQQLEKFIFEEKEKTHMDISDIPDPTAIDMNMNMFSNENFGSQSTLHDKDQQFKASPVKMNIDENLHKYHQESQQHLVHDRALNPHYIKTSKPKHVKSQSKQVLKGYTKIESIDNTPTEVFSHEDKTLIKLINREIAICSKKTKFMKDLQLFMRNYGNEKEEEEVEKQIIQEPKTEKKVRNPSEVQKISQQNFFSHSKSKGTFTDIQINSPLGSAYTIPSQIADSDNKRHTLSYNNYSALNNVDLQDELPDYILAFNDKKLVIQYKNVLKHYEQAKEKVTQQVMSTFKNTKMLTNEDICLGQALIHLLTIVDKTLPLSNDRSYLIDKSWDLVYKCLSSHQQMVYNLRMLKLKIDRNDYNIKLISNIKKLLKFNSKLLSPSSMLIYQFIYASLNYIAVNQFEQQFKFARMWIRKKQKVEEFDGQNFSRNLNLALNTQDFSAEKQEQSRMSGRSNSRSKMEKTIQEESQQMDRDFFRIGKNSKDIKSQISHFINAEQTKKNYL